MEAIEWARHGAEPGSVVIAREQTQGIGRLDHRWASPVGGLYLSLILDDPYGPNPMFTLAVGAKLRERLQERWGIGAAVKWPNDLVVPRADGRARKLAGILVDRVEAESGGRRLIVGIGLNVSAPGDRFPQELREEVVGLSDLTDAAPSLDEVETIVVDAIRAAHHWTNASSTDRAILDSCRDSLYGVGRRARVDGRPVGFIQGVDPDGSLVVGEMGRTERVSAGSVTIEEGA